METVKLGEIASFSQGLQVPIGDQETSCSSDDYVRFIRIVDYTEDTQDIRYIKRPDPRFFVNENDIVMIRYGSASMGMVGRGKRGVIANNMFKVTPDEKRIHKPYLFYCLQSDAVQRAIWLANASSTMPALTFTIASNLEIPLLPLATQRRISEILCVYDELMENCQRRIRILEAMSRTLYREWFVHFRFPSHETHARVASTLGEIPKGWEVCKLAELVDFVRGFEPGSDAYTSEPAPNRIKFLRVGDFSKRDSDTFIAAELADGRTLDVQDIAITLDGSVGLVRIGLAGAYSTGIRKLVVRDKARLGWSFLYHLLLSESIQATIQAHAKGTTIKHAGSAVAAFEFVSPPPVLVEKFEWATAPMFHQVLNLQEQMQNLRRTRDLLLPRLLSGQVSLEGCNG